MVNERIRDIPKIQELANTVQTLSQLEQALPVIRPVLEQIGIDTNDIADSLADVSELQRETEKLAILLDEFNDHFAERGWICYENLQIYIAKTAIEQAESGNLETAEEKLVAYYDPEVVEQQLNWLKRLGPFLQKAEPISEIDGEFVYNETQSRFDLAQKALDDYEAGRYHACIPVVLALADGLAQQSYVNAHGEGGALSSTEANHEAWNSIAGHSTGLERLKKVIMTSRKTTRTEEIEIPYRHGIMHGMDLNYDNELVAAKAWNLLFAVGEWAGKAETNELAAPDSDDNSTLDNVLEQLRDVDESRKKTQRTEKRIEEWEDRAISVGEDVPVSGEIAEYDEETPEHAFVSLLDEWKDENYWGMAQFFRDSDGNTEDPGFIRGQFEYTSLKSFEITDIHDETAFSDICVELQLDRSGEDVNERKEVRMVRIADDGETVIRGYNDGQWTLPSWASLV